MQKKYFKTSMKLMNVYLIQTVADIILNFKERTWYDNHRNQILSNSENPNAKDVER
jgi:hypothetical protein